MSYGPRIQQKLPAKYEERILYDKPPNFQPPQQCEAPPPGAFTLYAVDIKEAKADPNYTTRYMSLDECSSVMFGSSREVDGLVYDGNKGVKAEHACLYHAKGKWFLKAVNGNCYVDSMTLHSYLRDSDGRPPRRFQSDGSKKSQAITPMDSKKRMTRERCVFRMGESDRIFWLVGPLPLGEGEVEVEASREERGRKKDGEGGERKRKRGDKEGRRARERSPTRSRTRSRERSRTPKKRR